MEQYRLLRVLEYIGDRKFIDDAIMRRGVKGVHIVERRANGMCYIREAIVGDTCEVLNKAVESETVPMPLSKQMLTSALWGLALPKSEFEEFDAASLADKIFERLKQQEATSDGKQD